MARWPPAEAERAVQDGKCRDPACPSDDYGLHDLTWQPNRLVWGSKLLGVTFRTQSAETEHWCRSVREIGLTPRPPNISYPVFATCTQRLCVVNARARKSIIAQTSRRARVMSLGSQHLSCRTLDTSPSACHSKQQRQNANQSAFIGRNIMTSQVIPLSRRAAITVSHNCN